MTTNNPIIINALCIDVDDLCFTFSEAGYSVKKMSWGVEREVNVLLEHLNALGLSATFFIPGLVVKKSAGLVSVIAKAGHEIASHGWLHQPVVDLGEKVFREDVQRSRGELESLATQQVIIYKAPIWSICKHSLWALDILYESGFKVDHSILAATKKAMSIKADDMVPTRHSSGLLLIPPTVLRAGPFTVPMPGGGYAAYAPKSWLLSKYAQINASGLPFNFYLHPFEHNLVPENQGLIKGGSLRISLIYAHAGRFDALLQNLAAQFRFDTLSAAYDIPNLQRAANES
jgi:polysaccharide deacetylase family protein (PEP-CTERM system associated)